MVLGLAYLSLEGCQSVQLNFKLVSLNLHPRQLPLFLQEGVTHGFLRFFQFQDGLGALLSGLGWERGETGTSWDPAPSYSGDREESGREDPPGPSRHIIWEEFQSWGVGECCRWGGQRGSHGQTLCGSREKRILSPTQAEEAPGEPGGVERGGQNKATQDRRKSRSGQDGREMHKPGPEKAPLHLQECPNKQLDQLHHFQLPFPHVGLPRPGLFQHSPSGPLGDTMR